MGAGIVATLIGTGAAGTVLATLMVRLNRGLERQIDTLRVGVRGLRRDQASLHHRVSRIEGLLESHCETMTGRHAAAD